MFTGLLVCVSRLVEGIGIYKMPIANVIMDLREKEKIHH